MLFISATTICHFVTYHLNQKAPTRPGAGLRNLTSRDPVIHAPTGTTNPSWRHGGSGSPKTVAGVATGLWGPH